MLRTLVRDSVTVKVSKPALLALLLFATCFGALDAKPKADLGLVGVLDEGTTRKVWLENILASN
jgi:hypothetical protein